MHDSNVVMNCKKAIRHAPQTVTTVLLSSACAVCMKINGFMCCISAESYQQRHTNPACGGSHCTSLTSSSPPKRLDQCGGLPHVHTSCSHKHSGNLHLFTPGQPMVLGGLLDHSLPVCSLCSRCLPGALLSLCAWTILT